MPDINDLIAIIRAVDDSQTSKCGFDMQLIAFDRYYTEHPCGTACCIGGHAALALKKERMTPEQAVMSFGVGSSIDADMICYPDPKHPGWRAKPRHAIRLLEHYRDTGVVDWDFAMSEAE